jgi:hypothetical protein
MRRRDHLAAVVLQRVETKSALRVLSLSRLRMTSLRKLR